jgi:HSP20 family molecular chaperone IbpA
MPADPNAAPLDLEAIGDRVEVCVELPGVREKRGEIGGRDIRRQVVAEGHEAT